MDDVAELFRHVGQGNQPAVAQMLRFRPELSRARDASSLSILQFARYMRRDAILQVLVDTGPPLDVFDAAMLDRVDDLRALLDGEPSLARAYDDAGFTALHYASYFGATRAMTLLLERRANIEAVTRNFLANMALHAAAAGGRIEACALLLRAGADPNARQHGGFTPLMTAAFQNNRELAEMLIARAADVELRNDDGKTAADVAAANGNMELAARLRLDARVVDHSHA